MTLSRDQVVPGMVTEYQAFTELLAGLSDEEWGAPSRCAGWRAADVAGHVVGQLTDVVNLRLEGLGTPEVTQRQVDERHGRSPRQLAEELETGTKLAQDMVAGFDEVAWSSQFPGVTGTLGFGVEALWFDTYLHADDIRSAIGRPSVLHDGGNAASLSHIAQVLTDQGWSPATLALQGCPEFSVSGGGRRITGDPLAFVLVSTGRAPADSLGLDETVNIYRP
jgi:uncharacterized protein (TIGR03083 family)